MTTNPFAAFLNTPAPETQEQPGVQGPPTAPAVRRRLGTQEVRQIRQAWKYARDLSEGRAADFDSSSDWESVTETETRLADQFGVTVTSLRSIVRGTSYKNAGGPIDTERAQRHAMYTRLKETKGVDYARRYMAKVRTGEGLGNASHVVEITITSGGRDIQLYLDHGSVVSVAFVSDTGQAVLDLTELDAWVNNQV